LEGNYQPFGCTINKFFVVRFRSRHIDIAANRPASAGYSEKTVPSVPATDGMAGAAGTETAPKFFIEKNGAMVTFVLPKEIEF